MSPENNDGSIEEAIERDMEEEQRNATDRGIADKLKRGETIDDAVRYSE